MRALLIARKIWLELIREWQLLLLIAAIPTLFMAITKVGYDIPLLTTYSILTQNEDPHSAALLDEMAAQRYADGRPVFDLQPAGSPSAAEAALKDRKSALLITIAPDGAVSLTGDALSTSFYQAIIIVERVIDSHAERRAGHPEAVRLVEQPLAGASPQTMFDVYAPGMIVFALLMTIPQVAMLVAREIRQQTLRRLRLTLLRAGELFVGVSLAQMLIAVLLVALVLASAIALGFNSQGSFWLALAVGLAINFSAIGWGLLTACFVENDGQAINIGSTVTMLQVFVSGSFYQFPSMVLFTLAGHEIGLFDLVPATHGFGALQQVLCYGATLRDVGFRLGATLLLSLFYFALGVIVFQRRQMRRTAY